MGGLRAHLEGGCATGTLIGLATALAVLCGAPAAGAAVSATFYPEQFGPEQGGYLEIRGDETSNVVNISCVRGGPIEPEPPPTLHYWILKVNGADPSGGPAYCYAGSVEMDRLVAVIDARMEAGDDVLTFSVSEGPFDVHESLHKPRIGVDLGDGADYLAYQCGGPNLYLGGPGDDVMVPAGLGDPSDTQGSDFRGQEGDDTIVTIFGQCERDLIRGGLGNDTLHGESGDRIDSFGDGSDEGDDLIYGGTGDDVLSPSLGRDRVFGRTGDDIIALGADSDFAHGNGGDDRILGGSQADRLIGGIGTDRLRGGDQDDVLRGGRSTDRLQGGAGSDRLFGEEANDCLFGNGGRDFLFGGPGHDVLRGGRGRDFERPGPATPPPGCWFILSPPG